MIRKVIVNQIGKNSKFFMFLTLYTILISFMIQKSINEGALNLGELVIKSLLPIFFILILVFIIEILSLKITNNSLLVIFIKSFFFTIIPFLLAAIAILKIENGNFERFLIPFIGLFSISFYWFLLTTVSIFWLRWKATFILLLFILTPSISDLLGDTLIKQYLPFELVFTMLINIDTKGLLGLDFMILLAYIGALLIGLKIKKMVQPPINRTI